MPANCPPHPFDARSVLLFASIALGSALAQAQPAASSARSALSQAGSSPRVLQIERNPNPADPRRHLARQPVKKSL